LKKWRCIVCNYIHEGPMPPESCPICSVGPEHFVEVEESQGLSGEQKRLAEQAIFKISYGLYIIGSQAGGKVNAQVANTVFQITSQPLRIAIGVNKQNLTAEYIRQSGIFSVNILTTEDHDLVKHFGFQSGHKVDKFATIPYNLGETGAPLLQDVFAYLEVRVIPAMTVDVGTHWLFIGDVVGGKVEREGEPMTYAYYRSTRR